MNDPTPNDADPSNPWTRLARRAIYRNPWIAVYEDQVLRPDRQPGIYGVVHFLSRAVGAVAVDEHDRVLLVGQYRYTLDVYSWEIPEGGALHHETPLEAIQRELLEETGYRAASWQEIGRAHLSNSVSDEEGFVYLATDLKPGNACPDPTEQLQVMWMPFEKALRMVLDGAITDSLSVIGLQRLALLRLRGLAPCTS